MSYSLLKNVFPNFGETGTFVEHNYKKILEKDTKKTEVVASESEQIGAPISIARGVPDIAHKNIPGVPPIKSIEQFTTEDELIKDHTVYMKHILSCEECRKILEKQMGKNDKIDEAVIEMAMYVLFGVFILALLE
jgi:hypothetical protein